jgi:hypothetical protein
LKFRKPLHWESAILVYVSTVSIFATNTITLLISDNIWCKKLILEWIKRNSFEPFESVRFYLNFHIDIHHVRSCHEKDRWQRHTISRSSIAEQYSMTMCLLFDCMFIITFQYRHLSHSILPWTRSVLKEHDICLRHCGRMR